MEYDNFFFWSCVVLKAIGWTCDRISDFLIERNYSCHKSTVSRAIKRFNESGSPLKLKRGRPRESGIGKCTDTPPKKDYKSNVKITHALCKEQTY